MSKLPPSALLPLLLLLAAPLVQAHHVWLEQEGKTLKLQFGELAENRRETTPGLLDKFVAPTATLIKAGDARPLALRKTPAGFVLDGAPGAGESVVFEDKAYPMWESKRDGTTSRHVWSPAARLVSGFAAQPPVLTLDLVPTGKPQEFRVFYKRQPLARAKVGVLTASGWTRQASSDRDGLVRLALPWRGAYVLVAEHTDTTPGERVGQSYASATYVTSLSISVPEGLPAMPPTSPDAAH